MHRSRILCWLALLWIAGPAFASEPGELPRAAIGKVTYAGFSSRTQCTGSLIAPDLVLTAAHCLKAHDDGDPLPAGKIHFLAGYDRGVYRAHAVGKSIAFLPTDPEADAATRLNADAAVITLDAPLDPAPARLATKTDAVPDSVVHTGYMRSHPEILTVTAPCRVLALPSGLWASNCHAEPGSSGGPVFAVTRGGPALAGIVTAVNETGVSFVIPLALIRPLVKNHGE